MCVGIPMQVISSEDGMAECEGRGRRERLNAMLIGGTRARRLDPRLQRLGRARADAPTKRSRPTRPSTPSTPRSTAATSTASSPISSGREPTLPPHLKDPQA